MAPSADLVTVSAGNLTTSFSENQQNLTLAANVTDATNSGTTVGEGTVSFIVKSSSGNSIGTAQGTVSNGKVDASFTLPAGESAGNYTIAVSYANSAGNFSDDGTDTSGTLTINAANVLVKANNVSATFSTTDQPINLTASVIDPANSSDIVNEGTVRFTVKDSSGKQVGSTAQGKVNSGTATATFTLPANTTPGSYTIAVSFSDSPDDFSDNGTDTSGKLAVAATTTTTASNATTSFSNSDQNVTLNASVASSAGTVNEGSVTFTLIDNNGNTVGTSTSSAVNSNGQASVSFTLPGGTPVGSYSIDAAYSDTAGKFSPSSDFSRTLTVSSATATTLSLTTMNIVPNISNSTAQVTLTAHVSNPSGVVDQGELSITLGGVSGQGKVVNGTASVQLTVPIASVSNLAKVGLSYTDKDTPAKFGDDSTSATVAMNVWNVLMPTNLTFDSSGNEQNQVSAGGSTSLLGFSYTSAGLLTQVLLDSSSLPVTYSNVGRNTVTTFVGAPTAITFVGSNGQVLGDAQIFYDGTTLQWVLFDSNNQPIGETPYGI